MSVSSRVNIKISDFEKFLKEEALEFFYSEIVIKYNIYKNKYNNLAFIYDISTDKYIDNKYNERKNGRCSPRLLTEIDNAKSILIDHLEILEPNTLITDEILLEAYNKIQNKYSSEDTLLCASNDNKYHSYKINNDIKRAFLNYWLFKGKKREFVDNFNKLNNKSDRYASNISPFLVFKIEFLT